MNKKCNGCGKTKPIEMFGLESRSKSGLKSRCKQCLNAYYNSIYRSSKNIRSNKSATSKERYKRKRTEIIEKVNVYYKENKRKIISRQNKYISEKKKTDPHFYFVVRIRSLVYHSINKKRSNTEDLIGYTYDDLIKKLGRYPEIDEDLDHKIPISWFKLNTDLKIIFNLDNMQILKSIDNRKKGNRFSSSISKDYYDLAKPHIIEKYLKRINYDK